MTLAMDAFVQGHTAGSCSAYCPPRPPATLGSRATTQPGSPQPVLLQGVLPSLGLDFTFVLVLKVPICLFLQPILGPFQCQPCPQVRQLVPPVWCHLTPDESALCHLPQIIDKGG